MGNTVGREDHLLQVRAWKSNTILPISSDFPERQLPSLRAKPDTAIAFSGGGIRAYATTIGFLAGLRDAGYLDSVKYIGGVSSSSWAVSAFCFGNVQDDDVFLGPINQPDQISLNRLNIIDKDCIRRLAASKNDASVLIDGIFTAALDKQSNSFCMFFLHIVSIRRRKF